MSFNENNSPDAALDDATHNRLRALHSVPVDLSRVRDVIHAQIPRQQAHGALSITMWFRPMRVAAAGIVFLGIVIALVIASSTGPALASPERLAAIHVEAVDAHGGARTQVSSIAQANQQLKTQWAKAPDLPSVDGHEVRSCCLHHLDNKKLACVTLQIDGAPVTLAIADAGDIKCPHATMVTRNDVQYCVMNSGDLNIIMWVHNNRWASLVGKLPSERLLDAAEKIRF